MWSSSLLLNLQDCRLIAGKCNIKWTPSQVFFKSTLSPPRLPTCIDLRPLPHQILKSPTSPHVLNTCRKTCINSKYDNNFFEITLTVMYDIYDVCDIYIYMTYVILMYYMLCMTFVMYRNCKKIGSSYFLVGIMVYKEKLCF